jgi:hypothetical protein
VIVRLVCIDCEEDTMVKGPILFYSQLPRNITQNDFDSTQWRLSSAQEVQLPKKKMTVSTRRPWLAGKKQMYQTLILHITFDTIRSRFGIRQRSYVVFIDTSAPLMDGFKPCHMRYP